MKIIKHYVLLAVFMTALAVGSTACKMDTAAVPAEGRNISYQYSAEALKADFAQFRRIIERKTVQLYTDQEELQKNLHEAENSINRPMTELGFYRLLAPIVADLKCGHSFLSVSSNFEKHMREDARFFPAEIRIIDGRLFVIADHTDTGLVTGMEIVSINGEKTERIIDIIYTSVPTDGDDTGRLRYDTERWFASFYYTYVEPPAVFSLEVREPETTTIRAIEVPAVRDPSLAKTAQGVMHDTANTPWSVSIEDNYALLSIPTFNYSDKEGYARFLQTSFAKIAEKDLGTLILDLRGNYGGTPFPTVELFRYLIDKPLPFFAKDNPFYLNRWKKPVAKADDAFNGDLYVLIGEAGFSMNSFLVSLLKYHHIGTLIGAAMSGGYKCSDASINTTLRNTGLRLRYSTAVFQTAVEGFEDGIGIEPDIYVQWTLAHYLNGDDPVLDAALRSAGIE
jgi:hypothetical protein